MFIDESLNIVANKQRRKLLYTLRELEGYNLSYDELAEQMIEQDRMREEEKERFMASLAHNHLPKIADAGIIEYDEGEGEVSYVVDEDFEELLDFIEDLEEKQDF